MLRAVITLAVEWHVMHLNRTTATDAVTFQASPKLGIFFCLACSGIHRSLGVHISFVRSVTMDAFKLAEVRRMSLGGNAPFKAFFDEHPSNKVIGRDFESCTIAERYDSEAGEEWKERLTAKVEEREYVPGATKKDPPAKKAAAGEIPGSNSGSGRNTPQTQQGFGPESQKSKNEAYFANKGAENASRSADLPPSQGGKYAGFGSAPAPSNNHDDMSSPPAIDDFQKDPVAALTKGFGWLGSSFAKQAAVVNKSYIQPGLTNLQSGDLAAQAKQFGTNLGTGIQHTSRGLNNSFNSFIDPDHQQGASGSRTSGTRGGAAAPEKKDFWDSFGADPAGPPKEKKDFWDDFAAAGEAKTQQQTKPRNVGTSAMKSSSAPSRKEEDGAWGDW